VQPIPYAGSRPSRVRAERIRPFEVQEWCAGPRLSPGRRRPSSQSTSLQRGRPPERYDKREQPSRTVRAQGRTGSSLARDARTLGDAGGVLRESGESHPGRAARRGRHPANDRWTDSDLPGSRVGSGSYRGMAVFLKINACGCGGLPWSRQTNTGSRRSRCSHP
jgi:hypothetical protein